MQLKMNDLTIPEKRFRPEIEGVRVVASLLVAIYHIWLGSVSGGVDVFFVVSGYLITTSVLSRFENNGRFDYFSYVLNLGKRLIPIAFTVLSFTAIGAFLLLPKVQWKQIVAEIYSSVFYVENWQLARNAVDYLAQNNEASPVQHYWALSVQGQFYIIWPLVIFVAFLLARKLFKTPFRKTLLVVLITIFTLSISYSISITNSNQPWAYFDTFARVWEFSLGGILALLLPYLKTNKYISFIIGWLGLSIICLTGILLPVSTVFPGYAALLPISGVMFIIISAENHTKYGVDRLLSTKPFLYFGSVSYGFYLWHWPLLIFYYAIFQTDVVPLVDGLIIMIIAFGLSVFSTKKIEEPIRGLSLKHEKKKIASVLLLFLTTVIVVNTTWVIYHDRHEEVFKQNMRAEDYPGARVIFEDIETPPDVPPILTWNDDDNAMPRFYQDDCYVGMNEYGMKKCSYGNTVDPKYTVAIVGGSRDGHWFPAFEQFAEELQLQVDIYNKDGCKLSADDYGGLLSDSCMEWNELVVTHLLEDPPDLIFTTANGNGKAPLTDSYLDVFKKFEGVTNILAIRNIPEMPFDVPTCVEVKGAKKCKVPRNKVLQATPPWEGVEDLPENIYFVDLSDYLCDENYCYSVIGNVIVYRDDVHLSNLYASTLAEPLKKHVIKALENK